MFCILLFQTREIMHVDAAPVVYETGFNQSHMYDNKGYVAEQSTVQQSIPQDVVYATVQKKARTETQETVQRLEAEKAMEAHEHIEAVLREEAGPSQSAESETVIITEVDPEGYSGGDMKIITELVPDDEAGGQGTRHGAANRDVVMETQGIEVDIRDMSPHGSPGQTHRRVVEHHEETFIKTAM